MKATLESRRIQTVEKLALEICNWFVWENGSLLVGEGHFHRAESEVVVAYFI